MACFKSILGKKLQRFTVIGTAGSIVTFGVITACKTSPKKSANELKFENVDGNATAVDMNDLSYMFTKDSQGQIYPRIMLGQPWKGDPQSAGPIFSQDLYNQLKTLSETIDPNGNVPKDASGFRFEDFVVTAFRIDPCAPTLAMDEGRAPASGAGSPAANAAIKTTIGTFFGAPPGVGILPCVVQIRLIAQPVVPFTNFTQIDESSVHLVYRLNGDPRAFSPNGIMGSELAKDILILKTVSPEPTTELPLQEHPGLFKEAKGMSGGNYGGFATAVVSFLKKYIQAGSNGTNLTPANIAVMRSFRNSSGEKIDLMFAGGTDASQNFTAVPMPTSPKSPTRFFTVTSSGDRSNWFIRPVPEQNNVMDLMINKRLNFGLGNISALMNFDNPESTHFFGTDCLSCHGTSQMIKEGKIQNQDINVATRYPSPPGVTGYPLGKYLPDSAAARNGVVVRNFGWSGSMPIIGNRTVTETASVVNYMNHNIYNVHNQAKDCGTAEPEVWKSFVNLDENYDLNIGASENRKKLKNGIMRACSSTLTAPPVPQRIFVTAQGKSGPAAPPPTTPNAPNQVNVTIVNPSFLFGRNFSNVSSNTPMQVGFLGPDSTGTKLATVSLTGSTDSATWDILQPNIIALTLKNTKPSNNGETGMRYFTVISINQICLNGPNKEDPVGSVCLLAQTAR